MPSSKSSKKRGSTTRRAAGASARKGGGKASGGASKRAASKAAGGGKKAAGGASKKGASKAPKTQSSGIGEAVGSVFLINMIPRSLSGEANQDSEPHLTVNPTNPLQMVGTAFTPDPGGGVNAPVYITTDGGMTWSLNSIVPSAAGSGSGTGDITTGLNRNASKLYAAILRNPTGNQEFLRTNSFTSPTPMSILASRPNADQPFTHVATVTSGTDAGKDRLYIGNNDFNGPGGKTATIDQSLNAAVTTPAFSTIRIEKRTTVGQDGPQIRPVSHPDGTVYATFYRWRALTGSFGANTLVITSADVVVVRDDNGGKGTNPYTALVDPGDGLPGMRVARNVSFPFMRNGTAATGQQRIGGSLSIAVSPLDSSLVYLAWCDKPAGSTTIQTLHVRRSRDRGVTWSANDLLTVNGATNASLAINSAGKVALLYQQLRGTSGDMRWVTRVRRTTDGTNWDDLILANVPATIPAKIFDPYIGDYDHITAVGKDFYGIFSTSNVPDTTHFPNGVRYQRNVNFSTQKLLKLDNTTVVAPSIDPFFFKLTE